MKRIFLVVISFFLSLGIHAQAEMLLDSNRCSRKDMIRTMKKTKALISALKTKSDLLYNVKLSMMRLKPDVKRTLKSFRQCDLQVNWDDCTLWDDLHNLENTTVKEFLEYQNCKKDSLGNLQLWIRNVSIKYHDNNSFTGGLNVTVDDKGKIVNTNFVSEDFYELAEQYNRIFDSEDSNSRQFLLNWVGELQTKLIVHNIGDFVESFNEALWLTENTLRKAIYMELLSKLMLMPCDIDICKDRSGNYYRISMKVNIISYYAVDSFDIVAFWDFRNREKPCLLSFGMIGKNEKTINFSDLPLE